MLCLTYTLADGSGDEEGTAQIGDIITWPAASACNLWPSPAWIQEVRGSGNGRDDGGHGADVPVLQPGRAESSWGRGQLLWWERESTWVLGVAEAHHWRPLLWAANRQSIGLAAGFRSPFFLVSQAGWVTLSWMLPFFFLSFLLWGAVSWCIVKMLEHGAEPHWPLE